MHERFACLASHTTHIRAPWLGTRGLARTSQTCTPGCRAPDLDRRGWLCAARRGAATANRTALAGMETDACSSLALEACDSAAMGRCHLTVSFPWLVRLDRPSTHRMSAPGCRRTRRAAAATAWTRLAATSALAHRRGSSSGGKVQTWVSRMVKSSDLSGVQVQKTPRWTLASLCRSRHLGSASSANRHQGCCCARRQA